MLQLSQIVSIATGCSLSILWILFLKTSRFAWRFKDVPNHRSSHVQATPRGAGFAFALALLASALEFGGNWTLVIAAFIIACLGLYDDIKPLSARHRLLIQIASITFLLCILMRSWTSLDLVVKVIIGASLLIVGLASINFYNFADGINGHIGLQGAISLLAWLAVSSSEPPIFPLIFAPYLWAVLGAIIIFLWANLVKKWVFMGDTGSTFLGFFVVFTPLASAPASGFSLSDLCLLIGLVFSFNFVVFADCATIVLTKLWNKIPSSMPHRHHFYQRLSRKRGWTHAKSSCFLAMWQALISVGVLLALDGYRAAWIVSGLVAFAYSICVFYSAWTVKDELLKLNMKA